MTEAKRVSLTTISSTVSSSLITAGSSGNFRFSADFLAQTEKSTTAATGASTGVKGFAKTIRLNVELFQTDCNKYPEFNYAKLVHLEKKKLKKLKQKSNGFSDPFEDNDDDVKRIAKELEKKYGNAYSTGRGKSKRDDVDIGMGYDESDSFIDNTEAYDELIPDEVETIEGGFYINCGALEFKKLHTESYTTKTDEIIKMPNRPKKRVISSSSEESSSSGDDDNDDNDSEDDDDDESAEGSSVETSKSKSSGSATDKKTKSSSTTTSNPAKKKAVAAENGGVPKKSKEKNLSCSASSSPKISADDRASDIERNAKKIEKTTTVKDMLKAQRDNFLKSQTSSNGEAKSKSSPEDDSSSDDSDDDDEDEDDSDDNSDSNQSAAQVSKDKKPTSGIEGQGNEKLRICDTSLPELEPDVLTSIIEFRDGAKSQNLIGKKFQFDDKLSENFLKIDDSLLCLDKTQRNGVFAHLEFQLSLPKYYFLRKAKQLRIKEEKLKSKRTFNKLYKAITETMPAVIASYEVELRRYAELQSNSTTEQPPKLPKKKFPWNTNLRNLLYDVYQVRWTSYPVLGTRKETLEEFITSFMREKVVDIWPKGWMRYEELQKEIEKRKTAAKKAKEKKKAASAATSGQSSPNSNVTSNPLASIQISNVSSLSGTSVTAFLPNIAGATTTTQPVSFIKQFEEFTNRSNANSDTDSVASSSTSSGLKRKSADAVRNKPAKPKAQKLNGEKTKSINSNNSNNRIASTVISLDLVLPNKRTDHSINHIMTPTEGNVVSSMPSSIFSATTAAVSQPSKHSTSTHVIDLDNYKSVGDILQTSKEIQAAANAAASSITATNKSATLRRESSGDSEIEIVGVFPAKQQNKKLKSNNRTSTPNSNYINTEKTLASSSHHYSYHHSNNNNRKKGGNSGLNNLPGMDVNKMVNTLMELGDELQIKPALLSKTQEDAGSRQ